MDAVLQDLGEELTTILQEHQIDTVDTFLLLTQDMVMQGLGLKLGSWLRIDRAQQVLRSEGSSTKPIREPSNRNPDANQNNEEGVSSDTIKDIIESEFSCQSLLFGKLAEGRALQKKEKNLIFRTICLKIFKEAMKDDRKITPIEKRSLAKAIVETYDCLKCDVPGKPAEAEFFWECNGESKGPHTGFIQNWIRNAKSKSTSTIKRKRRIETSISEEEANAFEELCTIHATPESHHRIMQLLATTFKYRQSMRASNRSVFEITSEFPYLLNEDAIHQEFDLMFPERKNATSFESITQLCLMLKHEFDEIANDGIRAVAKISAELTQQGTRKSDQENPPPLEDFLAVFIRWRQDDKDMDYFLTNLADISPYVFCDTFAFAEGVYHVMINGSSLNCGHNFYAALDVALKSYKVFNYHVPSKAKKVVNFFDVLIYDSCKFSRTASVNNLCETIRKAMKSPADI